MALFSKLFGPQITIDPTLGRRLQERGITDTQGKAIIDPELVRASATPEAKKQRLQGQLAVEKQVGNVAKEKMDNVEKVASAAKKVADFPIPVPSKDVIVGAAKTAATNLLPTPFQALAQARIKNPDKFVSTITPKEIVKPAVDLNMTIPKIAARTALEFAPEGTVVTPKTPEEKFLFGEEPIRPITQKTGDSFLNLNLGSRTAQLVQRGLQNLGVSEQSSRKLSGVGVGLFATAFNNPFVAEEKKAVEGGIETIAKSSTAKEILPKLTELFQGASEEVLAPLATKLEKITDVDAVRKELASFFEGMGSVSKSELAAKSTGELSRVGNIRLDKFDLPEDAKKNLGDIILENKDFIDQRRGVMSFGDTERLAEGLAPIIRVKKGSALNAEELQNIGNTVATLQSKVDDFARKVSTPEGNTDMNLLELAKAKEELTYALSSMSGATAEAGRALSILRNIKKAVASNDVDLVREAVKLSGGRENVEKIAGALLNAPDNLAKIKIVRDAAKFTTTDKLYEIWLNSILSNPTTQAVNITGNFTRALMNIPIRATQAAIQNPWDRKVFFGEVPQQVVGLIGGVTDGIRKGLYVLRNDITEDAVTKLDVGNPPAIGGILGNIVRAPTKMLSAADEFFKAVVGTSEMRALAYRQAKQEGLKDKALYERMFELISNPTKELYDAVEYAKKESTFQTELSSGGQALMKLREKVPGLKYVLPFIKTPLNIAKDAVKTSPVGFANVVRKVAMGKYSELPANQMTKEIAQAAVGSMLSIPIVMAALDGRITGAAPRDKVERDVFYKDKEPYSIKIGDKWYSYRRIEPLATIVGTIADVTNIKTDEGLEQAALQIATILGSNLNDKTFLSGLSQFIEAVTDPANSAKWYSNLIAGFVPFSGAQRFATRLLDPVVRQPGSVMETIKAQTPGLSTSVRPLRDSFGDEVTRSTSQVVSPVGVVRKNNDAVNKELSRLGISIGFPRNTVQDMKLSDKEFDTYLKVSGQVTKTVLEQLITSDVWGQLSDNKKEELVDRVTSKVRTKVRDKLFPGKVNANKIREKLDGKNLSDKQIEEATKKVVEKIESGR